MKNSAHGFTLIELLVVISIIAVLSVIGMTIFTGVQSRARDTRRQTEVTAIAKALETNKVSGTTTYPQISSTWFAGSNVPSDPRGISPASPGTPNPQYIIAYTTTLGCTVNKPTVWSDTEEPTAPAVAGTGTGCSGSATVAVVADGIPVVADKAAAFQVCALLENGTAPNIFCVPNSQ